MSLMWIRQRDQGGGPQFDGQRTTTEWQEGWTCLSYVPPVNTPAWVGLLTDRPDLSPGRLHPVILSAFVTHFDPQPLGTSDGWDVTVTYRIGDPQSRDLPPTQRPAVIEVAPESVEVPTVVKQDGSPWINTAGDLIAGLVRTENHVVFSVQKNVAAVPAWSLSYADAVNNDAIVIRGLSVAAFHLLLKDLRIGNLSKENVNGLDYLFYPVSFSLIYNPRTWKTKVYNRGLYQIDASDNYIRCLDSEGEPTDEPQFLDADGAQLAFPVNPASIVTLEGWNHELLPFSALPLS